MNEVGTRGTGKYTGAVWDGKRWMREGEQVRIGSWAQTPAWGKAIVVAVAFGVIVALVWPFVVR